MSQGAVYRSLEGQGVLVTGGATGIGAAMVQAFARQGARVGFLDLDGAASAELAEHVVAAGAPRPWYRMVDVCDTEALQQAVRQAADEFGGLRVLVNNAGNDDRHAIDSLSPAYWRGRMEVNLDHQFFASQAAHPLMVAGGGGSIINLGSIIWVVGMDVAPAYSTAKAAIVGLTRSLARAFGPDDVRVNCIMPGAVITERQRRLWLTPESREEIRRAQCLAIDVLPEDVANLTLFLASDQARAITSQSYVIDGGWV